MKRYLIFGGSNIYPAGGWNDFVIDTENFDAAKVAIDIAPKAFSGCDWMHVIDTNDGKKVLEYPSK